ncbi:MAG: DUF5688 family protein [Lachnospiraceae bacterium]|nr:DUF5688 family protein [Lachnospiraceae bacterium]
MNFEEFSEAVTMKVRASADENSSIREVKVTRNNGICLTGLVLEKAGSRISPTVYLDGLYEKYREGEELDEIAGEISAAFDSPKEPFSLAVNALSDPAFIKSHVVYRLVHYDRNRELLSSVPHRRFLDLAVMYSVFLSSEGDYMSSVLVRNEHLKGWSIKDTELEEHARINSPKLLPMRIKSIISMLSELAGAEPDPGEERERELSEMYVATNEYGINGASILLYPDRIRSFAEEKKRDLYVLPSSVHEVILLPVYRRSDPAELKNLVSFVNRTQVREEEQLSDTLYCFKRKTGELEMVR